MKKQVWITFGLVFLIVKINAQKSCVWFATINGKKSEKVYKLRPVSNQHLLVCGAVEDTAKINTTTYFYSALPSAFIAEFDNNHNVIFTKTFQNITAPADPLYPYSYAYCKDVLKDNNNNYYVSINFSGTVKLDTLSLNASNGMLIVKLNSAGKLQWYYLLENSVPTSMQLDNSNLLVLAYSPMYSVYTPASMFLLKMNIYTGTIKKYLIGRNTSTSIKTGELVVKNNVYYAVCNFADSINFSTNQQIKSVKNAVAVMQIDTNLVIQKYSVLTGKDFKYNIVSDIKTDNNNNLYLTGTYNSNNLYINDTIRLSKPTLASRMFLVKLNSNMQYLWAKEEVQNPANNQNYGMREGYNIAIDNLNNLYVLGYLYNSVILGTDTISSNSFMLIQYNNNGQYQLSEKIAGNLGGIYDLEYANNHLFLSAPFSASVSICQNTITPAGATDTYIAELDKITSIENTDYSENTQMHIYPNPANEFIYTYKTLAPALYYYKITDAYGKEVQAGSLQTNRISIKQLPTGLYILNIYSDKAQYYFKLVVQH